MRLPDNWRRARVTLAIAAVTAVAWMLTLGAGFLYEAIVRGAFIPAFFELEVPFARVPFALTPLTATVIHAGFIHLLFNMAFLLLCGRAVEPVLGRAGVMILYVVGAYAGAAAYLALSPQDMDPMFSASGAVSAVIGAYALLFGRNKVMVSNLTLGLWLNALWLMATWVVFQAIVGFIYQAADPRIGLAANVGGFLVGLLLARPLLLFHYRRA